MRSKISIVLAAQKELGNWRSAPVLAVIEIASVVLVLCALLSQIKTRKRGNYDNIHFKAKPSSLIRR